MPLLPTLLPQMRRTVKWRERIAIHKKRRPAGWNTFEGDPYEICQATKRSEGALLDCLTLWLTRLFLEGDASEEASEKEWQARETQIRSMTEDLCSIPPEGTHLIIVSNEVGFALSHLTRWAGVSGTCREG